MSVETRMIQVIQAALPGVLVRYGYVPQEDEKKIPTLPYVVLERSGTEFITTICGTYTNGRFVDVAIVTYAKDAEDARDLADDALLALLNSEEKPDPQNETDNYDPEARAWSVTQILRVWDDAPSVRNRRKNHGRV